MDLHKHCGVGRDVLSIRRNTMRQSGYKERTYDERLTKKLYENEVLAERGKGWPRMRRLDRVKKSM